MSKTSVAAKRFGGFMKRNAMYFLILLCIASVATIIALSVTGNFGKTDIDLSGSNTDIGGDTPVINQPDDPVINDPVDDPVINEPKPLSFTAPVNGGVTVDYSDTVLVWSSTLEQYSVHTGLDFTSEDQKVFAAAAGTVSETGYDMLNGYYVVISHDEGYETRYYSLAEQLNVDAKDKVTEGQLIGTMSTSMATESLDGAHLHFEMSKNGEDINPVTVLVLNEK